MKGLLFTLALTLTLVSASAQTDIPSHLDSLMHYQELSWNEGSIEGFMKHYWQSDSLQFISSGNITKGWTQTLERYKKSYPDRATMGKLTFKNMTHTKVSDSHYLVYGQWKLEREVKDDVSGYYSLLWKQIDGKWVIISDTTM